MKLSIRKQSNPLLCLLGLILAIVVSGTIAYSSDLERARDDLLKQDEQLKQAYAVTLTNIENLSRRLDEQTRKKQYLEEELKRVDDSIKSVDNSLKTY